MGAEVLLDGIPADRYKLMHPEMLTPGDREQLLLAEEQRRHETQTVEQVALMQAQAIGLATFCDVFMQVMAGSQAVQWTRAEILELLQAAVRGR